MQQIDMIFQISMLYYIAIILHAYESFNWTFRQWSLICATYNIYELDNIGLILYHYATKLITKKTWKEARMKFGINLVLIYWSIRLF